MKKTLLTTVVTLVAIFAAGCRGWPQAHDDVLKIQSAFKVLRAHTQAVNPTDTATIASIEDNIDASLVDMEQLSR